MSQVRTKAREIVEQYGRDGVLSAESLDAAEFGVWDRLTPGTLLFTAFCLAAVDDPGLAERIAESGDIALCQLASGDLRPIEVSAEDMARIWDKALTQLVAYARAPDTSSITLDFLLTESEDFWAELIESGDLTLPGVRNGESGPWDAAESPTPPEVERLDCGVLKVPRLEGARIHPLNAGERTVGVVVSLGDHAFTLQAFRAPSGPVWGSARPKVIQEVLNQGGTAEEAESSLGAEIRAQAPVVKDGQQVLQPTRIVGCDGPGWLLRGVYGGPKALADVIDPRAYYLFTQTIVDLPSAPTDGAVEVTVLEVTMQGG